MNLNFFQPSDLEASTTRTAISLPTSYTHESPRKITAEESEFKAYRTLRITRANARFEGVRRIRAAKVSPLSRLNIFTELILCMSIEGGRGGQQEKINYLILLLFCILPYLRAHWHLDLKLHHVVNVSIVAPHALYANMIFSFIRVL